ncbi:hypothetical protein EVAR_22197_1 [Eumeta japonica]|uniref:Uncharacterized protein n=1 Tax=Eumeta variegata TaxID=151549 RepID=A0A4C1UAE1_EUMVA|nr:hypothetical protein EVAR_22197_1 [Eumeta japonica]
MNGSGATEQIYTSNVCDGKVGEGHHKKFNVDHANGILKKRLNFKHAKPTNLHEKIDGCQRGSKFAAMPDDATAMAIFFFLRVFCPEKDSSKMFSRYHPTSVCIYPLNEESMRCCLYWHLLKCRTSDYRLLVSQDQDMPLDMQDVKSHSPFKRNSAKCMLVKYDDMTLYRSTWNEMVFPTRCADIFAIELLEVFCSQIRAPRCNSRPKFDHCSHRLVRLRSLIQRESRHLRRYRNEEIGVFPRVRITNSGRRTEE